MNLFREAAKFIGWLTGSLAGIGAILYACGYILIHANLNLLGFEDLLSYGHEYYLQEGADFFMKIMAISSEILLSLFAFLLVIILPFALFMIVKRRSVFPWLEKTRMQLSETSQKSSRVLKTVFIILSVLIFFHLLDNLNSSYAPLQISNLFYMEIQDLNGKLKNVEILSTREKISLWLVRGERRQLESHLIGLLLLVMESGVLLYWVWLLTARWRLRIVMLAPVVVVFATYATLLPMAYGVLVKEIDIFPFEPTFKGENIPALRNLYLLNKTAKEFLLWNISEKKLYWVPSSEISSAVIGSRQSLSGIMADIEAKERKDAGSK